MTDQVQASQQDAEDEIIAPSRLGLRLVFLGLAMMTLAAGLMWWHFGPSMFMSLLTAAANCF